MGLWSSRPIIKVMIASLKKLTDITPSPARDAQALPNARLSDMSENNVCFSWTSGTTSEYILQILDDAQV